jgi:hypothetical protein
MFHIDHIVALQILASHSSEGGAERDVRYQKDIMLDHFTFTVVYDCHTYIIRHANSNSHK